MTDMITDLDIYCSSNISGIHEYYQPQNTIAAVVKDIHAVVQHVDSMYRYPILRILQSSCSIALCTPLLALCTLFPEKVAG